MPQKALMSSDSYLVYSPLQSAIIYWEIFFKTTKNKLQVKQNHIMKTLCNKFGTKTQLKPLYEQLQVLNIDGYYKLEFYGLKYRSYLTSLKYRSYLTNRKQFVSGNGYSSSLFKYKHRSVPRQCIRPLFFFSFISMTYLIVTTLTKHCMQMTVFMAKVNLIYGQSQFN